MAAALTITYAVRVSPFVYDPGAFVIGAVHRPPDAQEEAGQPVRAARPTAGAGLGLAPAL
jgi:hypothetical protein